MLKPSTLGLIGALLVATACENGIGSKPYDENVHATSAAASQPVRLTGCVLQRNGALILQASVSPDGSGGQPSQRPASASASADSGSAAPAMIPPQFAQSTTANGPWVGSRSFRIANAESARDHVGSMVLVIGNVTVPDAQAAGTDQMQMARGAVFPTLEVAGLEPIRGECAASRNVRFEH